MQGDDAIWAAGGGSEDLRDWVAPDERDEYFWNCIMSGEITPPEREHNDY